MRSRHPTREESASANKLEPLLPKETIPSDSKIHHELLRIHLIHLLTWEHVSVANELTEVLVDWLDYYSK